MLSKNKLLLRFLGQFLNQTLANNYSFLILGPRQVGKTTLVKESLKKIKNIMEYPLQNPSVRLRLEADPGRIIKEIEALKKPPYVFIDEVQKVPELFDAVQYLIDGKKAKFILTGSSARKLRRRQVNLLPGRIKYFHLDPLAWGELGYIKESNLKPLKQNNLNQNINYSFEESLVFGSLPGIVTLPKNERKDFLKAYAEIYLEEEIRAEAISRKIGAFSRFLELAACESGSSPNLTKLSNESGVSLPAIKEFYQVLEDTLVIERVDPFLKNARKRILSFSRYYFFDLGVKNALSQVSLDRGLINAQKGLLFEHAVILEIIRRIKILNRNYKVFYWRTAGGAEVDCVIDLGKEVIPIEIKATDYVGGNDIKGLKIFLNDYKKIAKKAYVITLGQRKEKLAENITALPWFEM